MAGTAGFEYEGDSGKSGGSDKSGGGGMDPEVLKAGLLMEAAEAQQKAAQNAVHRFEVVASALVPLIERSIERGLERGLTRHVDVAVREAVARITSDELQQVQAEARRVASSLQRLRDQVQRGVTVRTGWLAAGVSFGTAFLVVCLLFLLDWLPGGGGAAVSDAVPAGVGDRVGAVAAAAVVRGPPAVLAEMARRGLVVDLRFCGDGRRSPPGVCVRIESKANQGGVQNDPGNVGRSVQPQRSNSVQP